MKPLENHNICVSLYIFFAPADSELDVTSFGLTCNRVQTENLEEKKMEFQF